MVYHMFSPVKLLAYECTCESSFRMFKQLQTVRDRWTACWDHSPVHSFNRNIGRAFCSGEIGDATGFPLRHFAVDDVRQPRISLGWMGNIHGGFGTPQNGCFMMENPFNIRMISGCLHFRRPPYVPSSGCPDWTHGIMFRISKNLARNSHRIPGLVNVLHNELENHHVSWENQLFP